MKKVQKAEKDAGTTVAKAKKKAAKMVDDANRKADEIRAKAKAEADSQAKKAFDEVVEEEAGKAAEYDKELDAMILRQKEEAMKRKDEVVSSVIAGVI